MTIKTLFSLTNRTLIGLALISAPFLCTLPVLAQQTFTLSAKTSFTKVVLPDYAQFEVESYNPMWVTIKSTADSNHGKWAAADWIFTGNEGTFKLVLTGRQERDGESTYKIKINGVPVDSGHKNNVLPNGAREFLPQDHVFPNTLLKKGDTIRVEANCVTNGTVKLDSINFSYAGGRWNQLKLTQIPEISIEPASITLEPNDVTIVNGALAKFKAKAKGTGILKYRWQKYGDTSSLGSDTVFAFIPTLADSGNRYFCIATNDSSKDTTRLALLSVSTSVCTPIFKVSGDTIKVVEGKPVKLTSNVACSSIIQWLAIKGPAPKIIDPEVTQFTFTAPRVTEETLIEYQFKATFLDSIRTKNIVVKIYDSIPDPKLTLPDTIRWNGKEGFAIKPTLTNASALNSSPYKVELNYFWLIAELFSDTLQKGDSISLYNPAQNGFYTLTACVNNGGINSCKESVLELSSTVGVLQYSPLRNKSLQRAANQLYRINSRTTDIWDFQGRHLKSIPTVPAKGTGSN